MGGLVGMENSNMNHDTSDGAERLSVPVATELAASFRPATHPHSLAFLDYQCKFWMKRIGLHVQQLTTEANTPWLARVVQRSFWQELGLDDPNQAPEKIADNQAAEEHESYWHTPIFLWPKDKPFVLKISIEAMRRILEKIDCTRPSYLSIVEANLRKLKELLNLSEAESKLLTLAWCVGKEQERDDKSDLLSALSLCPMTIFDDESTTERNTRLATLLDEPVDAVALLFNPCFKLVALRFLDAKPWHEQKTLLDFVQATDEFVDLLETPHRSDDALLAYILEQEHDWLLGSESVNPTELITSEYNGHNVEEAYLHSRFNKLLPARAVCSVAEWFSGMEYDTTLFEPTAERIDFEGIREAVKSAVLDCCTVDEPVTELAVLKAIYAASK
jgi:hypothetical protein